ncbi:MAG: hypothetical protein WD877_01745 [Candidatus Saccharimonadales bacterium]
MILLKNPPQLDDVRNFIAKVPQYPISAQQVLALAKNSRAPQEVIELFSIFPADTVFTDKDDLTSRSELVSILESQDEAENDAFNPEED